MNRNDLTGIGHNKVYVVAALAGLYNLVIDDDTIFKPYAVSFTLTTDATGGGRSIYLNLVDVPSVQLLFQYDIDADVAPDSSSGYEIFTNGQLRDIPTNINGTIKQRVLPEFWIEENQQMSIQVTGISVGDVLTDLIVYGREWIV